MIPEATFFLSSDVDLQSLGPINDYTAWTPAQAVVNANGSIDQLRSLMVETQLVLPDLTPWTDWITEAIVRPLVVGVAETCGWQHERGTTSLLQ